MANLKRQGRISSGARQANGQVIVHVMNRVVRRCFLLGTDPVTGKNFDHRKDLSRKSLKTPKQEFGFFHGKKR